MGVILNHELEMLSLRLGSLAEEEVTSGWAANVVVAAEGNVTAGGDPKPLHLAWALTRGGGDLERDLRLPGAPALLYLRQDGGFPQGAVEDGWAVERRASSC